MHLCMHSSPLIPTNRQRSAETASHKHSKSLQVPTLLGVGLFAEAKCCAAGPQKYRLRRVASHKNIIPQENSLLRIATHLDDMSRENHPRHLFHQEMVILTSC